MSAIGITGGVASGKSTFTALLAEALRAEVFDSDSFVHHLLENSRETISELGRIFGDGVMTEKQTVDRKKLGAIVFSDPSKRRALEAIVHPRVREGWRRQMEVPGEDDRWLLIDIPLLFETGAERELPSTVLVACSRQVQLDRLEKTRGLDRGRALRVIDAQMEMAEKIPRAAHVVWNDGSLEALRQQTRMIAHLFAGQ